MAALDDSVTRALGIPPLHESDTLLLYLVILALYKEGVRPTYSEVHYKLKEYQSPWDVERNFLVYYLLQPQRYLLKNGPTVLNPSAATARLLLTQHISRSRSRKPAHAPPTPTCARPFQATDVVIYFNEEPAWFQGWVNLKDGENHYSLRLWCVLISFFRACTSSSPAHPLASVFKQTRYSLAKSLKALGPAEIRNMRLGEIAHMAQLAIQHGFLCYEASTIQPTWSSYTLASMKSFQLNLQVWPDDSQGARELIEKYSQVSQDGTLTPSTEIPQSLLRKKASLWKPDEEDQSTTVSSTFKSSPRAELPPLTDVNELRAAIKRLLSLQDCGQILLSQLRVILQTRMNINLVPWTLGYAKLSNLLIAECSDVCHLVRHGGRHVFVEACGGNGSLEASSPSGCLLPCVAEEDTMSAAGSSSQPSSSSGLCKMDSEIPRLTVEDSPTVTTTATETLETTGVASQVAGFAGLSGCIQNIVPLYFLDYEPGVLDYVVAAGRSLSPSDWSYTECVTIAERLRGCRLSVLFHALPVSLVHLPASPPVAFDSLIAIDWDRNSDPPALLLPALMDI